MEIYHSATTIKIKDPNRSNGFQSTEFNQGRLNEEFYGWIYFGNSRSQEKYLSIWNELTQETSVDQPLTPELAKSLIGQEIEVYYTGNNEHKYEMTIKPLKVGSRSSNQIAQTTEATMEFNKIKDCFECISDPNEIYEFMYEWQGSFRVTGSAHIVYLKKQKL